MNTEGDPPTPPAPVHRIVELAAGLFTPGGDEPYHLPEPARERIRSELRALFGSPELKTACGDLVRLACWLDTEARSPAAAKAILELLEIALEPLEALFAETDPETLAGAKQRFDRFRDAEGGPKAPKVGEDAPKGSVKLGSLDYPKRG